MTFEFETGLPAQALYQNLETKARRGFAVDSGCDVSINSGTLGAVDTLSVASGTILFDGDEVSVSSQNTQIDASDPDSPRKDVIYLDGNGDVQVAKGTAENTLSQQDDLGVTRFNNITPEPPSLSNTDAVVLAEVWVGAGETSITTSDLADRRAFGTVSASGGGGGYDTITSVSSDTTAEANQLVLVDASGGAVTVTLPTPEESKSLGVERTDDSDNDVTIDPNDGENVNYGSSEDLVAQGESLDLVSDGTDWYVV